MDDTTTNHNSEIGKWNNLLHQETEPDSTPPIEPKLIPLIQFFVGEDQKFKILMNERMYTDKAIFSRVINEMKNWFEFQIPHIEEIFERYEEKKLNTKN